MKKRIYVTPEGSRVVSIYRGGRFASYERDNDGDITLLLSDRKPDADPNWRTIVDSESVKLEDFEESLDKSYKFIYETDEFEDVRFPDNPEPYFSWLAYGVYET